MKNHEYIRQLSVKELAKLLIHSEEVNEGDEGMDGESCDFYVTHYNMPDGRWSYDHEDAVEHTMNWLNADRK